MFSVEHASSTGSAVMEGGGGERRRGEEQQASCLVAKQAVEFPQVLTSSKCNFMPVHSLVISSSHGTGLLSCFS